MSLIIEKSRGQVENPEGGYADNAEEELPATYMNRQKTQSN